MARIVDEAINTTHAVVTLHDKRHIDIQLLRDTKKGI